MIRTITDANQGEKAQHNSICSSDRNVFFAENVSIIPWPVCAALECAEYLYTPLCQHAYYNLVIFLECFATVLIKNGFYIICSILTHPRVSY